MDSDNAPVWGNFVCGIGADPAACLRADDKSLLEEDSWLMLLSNNLGRRHAVLEKASPVHVLRSQSRPDSCQRHFVLVVLGFGVLRQDLGQHQPGLELLILLPLTIECWDRIYVQPHLNKGSS